MGRRDVALKEYLSIPEVFADVFNGSFFQGEPILTADKLEPMDSALSKLQIDKNENIFSIQKYRDVVKKVAFGVEFAIVGLENQDSVHYGMPVRDMLYDALEYQEQMHRMSRRNRKEGKLKAGEFLSGLKKGDSLLPIVTLNLYYGKEKWDGPECLHDLLNFNGELGQLRAFVPDYRMNLLWARNVPELERYQTGIRELFGVLKYDQDKQALQHYIQSNRSRFEQMDSRLFDVISVLTQTRELMEIKEKVTQKGGSVDMCKAIQEIKAEGIQIGEQKGIQIGEQKGIQIGEEKLAGLLLQLQQEGRTEEMLRCIQEKEFRDKMLLEFYK